MDDDDAALRGMIDNLNVYEKAELRLIMSKPEEFRDVRIIYIMVVGAHKKILDQKLQGFNALIPGKPDRDVVRQKYAEGISRHRSMRAILIQEAEQNGTISRIMEEEWIDSLNDKVSMLHQKASELGLVNMEAVSKVQGMILRTNMGGTRKV
jgi:hypothetical protein